MSYTLFLFMQAEYYEDYKGLLLKDQQLEQADEMSVFFN